MNIFRYTLTKTVFLLFVFFFSFSEGYAVDYKNHITWQQMPPLPPNDGQSIQYGLASPFAGSYKNWVLVAGGCNFPDIPAAAGGKKKYYDDIFLFKNNI